MYRLLIFVSPLSGVDRDGLESLEERILAALGGSQTVLDHDLGRGHLKVVIRTDDPEGVWNLAKAVIPDAILPTVGASYSVLGESAKHSLWPRSAPGNG